MRAYRGVYEARNRCHPSSRREEPAKWVSRKAAAGEIVPVAILRPSRASGRVNSAPLQDEVRVARHRTDPRADPALMRLARSIDPVKQKRPVASAPCISSMMRVVL
jgi:hypothetical protein